MSRQANEDKLLEAYKAFRGRLADLAIADEYKVEFDRAFGEGFKAGRVFGPWYPIEAAPRDGTIMLGWVNYYGADYTPIVMRWFAYNGAKAFRTLDGEMLGIGPDDVTHWMPFPAPPKETTHLTEASDEQ